MQHPPQIPLTPQTDPRNFPAHDPNAPPGKSGHPYPKMLTRPFTERDREQWLKLNGRREPGTTELWYAERPPEVDSSVPILTTREMVTAGLAPLANEPVIANDCDEEARLLTWLADHGIIPKPDVPEEVPHPRSIVVEVEAAEPVRTMNKRKHRKRSSKRRKAKPTAAAPTEVQEQSP
jgi:hypothetical protein